MEQGRYVEIRGDAGVGKSALLKHVAEGLSKEAGIIAVLSPERTPPGGWIGMKSVLDFDGTAHDLLVDMAGSYRTTIFIDGIDFFPKEKRLTVRDLVREAARTPAVMVIATARTDFGGDGDPNWLPADALDSLGRADPVIVRELIETEVDELRSAAPELGLLLAASHPARAVARNLFRLSRLSEYTVAESPRTEIDMTEQWWRSADGGIDGRRDRSRLLHDLAEQAILGTEPSDARRHSSHAVDTLVQSQTLRDFGGDRVAFRHDIYRDWAIAYVLYSQPDIRKRLPLERPAPAALVRGVELAARLSLERGNDDSGWRLLLDAVSHDGIHGSWRRAVLLAPVRSEVAGDLLPRISHCMLADGASLLRELIRTVIAVDSLPAHAIAAPGIDPSTVPERLHVPGSPSWFRLIHWLLGLGQSLPSAAIPEVADLYAGWCFLGENQLTPKLVSCFHLWLSEIESARYPEHRRQLRKPFSGAISGEKAHLLETNLRDLLLSYCYHTPAIAADYLQSLKASADHDWLTRHVILNPGSLAMAVPDDLVQFTIDALITDPAQREFDSSHNRDAFGYANHLFLLPSPELGPFHSLLTHAPTAGLKLIHRIVEHAVSVYCVGGSDSANLITIPFDGEDWTFSCPQSYTWSRPHRAPDSVVTTALMALSMWANSRPRNGASIEIVLEEMIGSSNAPAAYLLVAVDLLRAQWPLSRDAAVPFVACPELLCLDQELALSERYSGGITENSTARTVRLSLYDLLPQYAMVPPFEHRDRLASLLRAAAERLGPYGERSHRGHPDFMAFHALNMVDPSNWRTVDQADGTQTVEYVVPDEEERHLARLSKEFHGQHTDAVLRYAIMSALEDSTKSSPGLLVEATEWARRRTGTTQDHSLIVASAALAMRDGNDGLRERTEAWARMVLTNTLQMPLSPFAADSGLRFNAVAIAFIGWVQLLKLSKSREERRAILNLTARDDCAALRGFRAVATVLAGIDERLLSAVHRTAFAACIRTRDNGRESASHSADRGDTDQRRVHSAINAELSWLEGTGDQPTWPQFPLRPLRTRSAYISLNPDFHGERDSPPSPPSREHANLHFAARWLKSACDLFDPARTPWLRNMAKAYEKWTAVANGAESDDTPRHDPELNEWNAAYFALMAHCMPSMAPPEMDSFALNLITSLADEPFLDASELFLRNVDKMYFGGRGLNEQQAVHIRSRLVERLTRSRGWRHYSVGSMSVENNLGRAIAALFVADGYIRPPRCLLRPDGVDRMEPLLPVLQPIAVRFTAFHVVLSLFEVETRSDHLEFIIVAAEAWLRTHPDSSMFWVDYEAGRRVCSLIDAIRQQHPPSLRQGSALRNRVDYVLSALVSTAVAEAAHLEDVLSSDEA